MSLYDNSMANQTSVDSEQQSTSTPPAQLQYPQLLIEASFESLLSHSHSSGSRTVVPMPRSDHSLGESWSSLSEHDYTHDDDLTSEATDTGSLIDVNTAEDVHSVDEDRNSSDADEDHLEPYNTTHSHDDRFVFGRVMGNRDTQGFESQCIKAHSVGSIRLEDSVVVVDSTGATSLQASKTFTEIAGLSHSNRLHIEGSTQSLMVTIKMSMMREGLQQVKQPYNILYHGSTLTSSEIKSEVLGKIGATLIRSTNRFDRDEETKPPCFHVVPAEFGPDLTPSTADLIPVPTRMHITDCTLPTGLNRVWSGSNITLELSTGRRVISRQAKLFESSNHSQWVQPDLAVIVVSQHEDHANRMKAERFVEFANRHSIPILCLRQEEGWSEDDFLTDATPDMLHKVLQSPSEHENDDRGRKMLVDVDMFRLLDTEQLSQHINFLTTAAARARRSHTTLAGQVKFQAKKLYRSVTDWWSSKSSQNLANTNEGLRGSNWMIESLPARETLHQPFGKNQNTADHSPRVTETTRVLRMIQSGATIAMVTALTLLYFYTWQATLLRVLSPQANSTQNASIAQVSAVHSSLSTTAISASAAASASTQVFALSGPLQVLEQQVQNWMPLHVHGAEKKQEKKAVKGTVECVDVASAHISPTLKVDPAFFESGVPAFGIRVYRNKDLIEATIQTQSHGTAAILIKRKDLRGQLQIYVEGSKKTVCAFVDLENSVSEALALWLKNHDEQKRVGRNAKELADRYTRLIEVRTTKSGFVSNALELHYSAVQGVGAVVEAVEKSAVKHIRACQQDRGQCFLPHTDLTKEISKSVQRAKDSIQQAKDVSEDLVHHVRERVTDSTRQARSRANGATQRAQEDVSRMVEAMQTSLGQLASWRSVWRGKVVQKLADAQDRSHKLVRSGRKDGKKSLACTEAV